MNGTQKRKDRYEMFFEVMKKSFLEKNPDFEGASDEEIFLQIDANMNQQQEKRRMKLRDHLEVFSDAVIAIIITIMVLEIQLPLDGNHYGEFLASIGIFLISFFIVADFWMDHHRIFSDCEKISERILLIDFLFLAGLSLIPIMTKWMMEETSVLVLLNYGVTYMIVKLLLQLEHHFLFFENHDTHLTKGKRFQRMSVVKLIVTLILNAGIMAFIFFHLEIGRWLYCLLPIFSFVSSAISPDSGGISQRMRSPQK